MTLVQRLGLACAIVGLGCGGGHGHGALGSSSKNAGATSSTTGSAEGGMAAAAAMPTGSSMAGATPGGLSGPAPGNSTGSTPGLTDAAVSVDASSSPISNFDAATYAYDAQIAYSVTLTMDTFSVDPGAEVYKCQDFANPFGGQYADIKQYHSVMSVGSHHFTLFNTQGASDRPLVDCPEGGLMAGTYTYGAQSRDATYLLPPAVGVAIPGDMGFTMNAHYLNAGTMPVQGNVVLTMSVADPGTVTQHAGAMQMVLLSIAVPPGGQPVTVGSSCPLMQDMNVMVVTSHMHHQASHFIATTGGMTLLETDQWTDAPATGFWPPLQLKSGDDFTWSCIYTNDTPNTLTYGPSAETNVMCNAVVTFYPVVDITAPLLTCQM